MGIQGLPLRHLVMIVPGIGGSVLRSADGTTLWGGPLHRFTLNALVPHSLHLDQHRELMPTGLLSTASRLPGFTALHPYDALIRSIERTFTGVVVDRGDPRARNLAANVVAVPYDFRRSIVEASARLATEVTERLDHRRGQGHDEQVVVIAHSMGGLVARHWLATDPDAPERCAALITLGTPHRGAPKAADWLVNGARVKGITLDAATDVIRSWDSVYELLPRYPSIQPISPSGDRGAALRPAELDHAVWHGKAGPALDLHQAIQRRWEALNTNGDGPAVTPISGDGHRTALGLTWADGRLTPLYDPPSWLPASSHTGDGTVPHVSSIPIEFSDRTTSWHSTPAMHGALAHEQRAVDQLRALNDPSIRSVQAGDDRAPGPGIGTDIPDTLLAGESTDIAVSLTNLETGLPTPSWTVTLDANTDPSFDAAIAIEVGASGESNEAVVTLPPLPPGEYTLSISARVDGTSDQPAPVTTYLAAVSEH